MFEYGTSRVQVQRVTTTCYALCSCLYLTYLYTCKDIPCYAEVTERIPTDRSPPHLPRAYNLTSQVKLPLGSIKHHDMKACGGLEARLHAFLRGNSWRCVVNVILPNALPPGNKFQVPTEQETSEKIKISCSRESN